MKLKKMFKYIKYLLFGVFTGLVFIGGHSMGKVSEKEVLDACLNDLHNQCGLTIEYALLLERENTKLNKGIQCCLISATTMMTSKVAGAILIVLGVGMIYSARQLSKLKERLKKRSQDIDTYM